MKGKLIVIEGTDSSGKATQAKLLVSKLKEMGIKAENKCFPMYDTPTGKIIGNCLLNKNGEGLFKEDIPPKVAALFYAADRAYNVSQINHLLDAGVNVMIDRYVESNMAYQAAKFTSTADKINMLLWMEQLEFNLLDLPKPDKVIFLYLPYNYRYLLHNDEEKDNLQSIEEVYNLMTERYNFDVVYAIKDEKLKTIDEINEEILNIVNNYINQV